ncbi:MAG: SPFH domain / Band 7 family protein [Lentisphaerae bacterium ADurb.Bin242]|nr:MAG: SPFH domain / Band 7 family protein [Lentisphaerae bacterium ADurb.Bin242]
MKKIALFSIFLILVLCVAAYGIYLWFFCRFYVAPGCMAIVTAKSGDDPKAGELLVERGEKGIWKEVLPEGRYFLDPVMYDVDIVPAVTIPIGKVGIVTSKIGKPLPSGEIIAPDKSYQGVWRDVLGPGTYRLNPQGYRVDIADAINIPIGYVGVVTSQTGKPAPAGEFAILGSQGVFKDILQPGLYYINPNAYQVNVIEIGMNQVSMTGRGGSVIELKNKIETASDALKEMSYNTLNVQLQQRMKSKSETMSQMATSSFVRDEEGVRKVQKEKRMKPAAPFMAPPITAAPGKAAAKPQEMVYNISSFVEFPSRDGFRIVMDMTVEFELLPENVSKIYMLYGDLPQVVEKIILPQILSISRLKGSTYKAQDFIVGEGRETFQNNLRNDLVATLKEKSILIHNAIIRNVEIPQNILSPIQDASLAREQNLTNFSLQAAAKIEAELNAQTGMIEQKRQEVEQETRKLVAEINANQEQEVRRIAARTDLEVARIQLERSGIDAKREKLMGETAVKVDFIQQNEIAQGTRRKAEALGKPGLMADMRLIETLNPKLEVKVIYAGDGTLWTDLKSGTLSIDGKK